MKRQDPGRDVSVWCPHLSRRQYDAALLGVAEHCLGAEGRLAWAAFSSSRWFKGTSCQHVHLGPCLFGPSLPEEQQ